MRELDKTKCYELSDLTNKELQQIYNCTFEPQHKYKYLYYWDGNPTFANDNELFNKVVNAKEPFYTLENIQVDCRKLTSKEIQEMYFIVENNNYNTKKDLHRCTDWFYFSYNKKRCCFSENRSRDNDKTTITYENFMYLFGNKEKSEEFKNLVEVLNEELTEEAYKETSNKLNYELDFNFITQLAERMAQNKHKYEPYNWQKLDNITELKQALYRHVMEVMKGNYEDDNRLFGHLESIALNAMFINYQLKKTQ